MHQAIAILIQDVPNEGEVKGALLLETVVLGHLPYLLDDVSDLFVLRGGSFLV